MKLREKMWLWGQTPGSHHAVGNPFKIPGENKMTAMEGGKHFGIPNVFRVVMADMPKKEEFDREAQDLDGFDKIFWSLIGSGGSKHELVVDEVLALAEKYDKIEGAITDDFLTNERMKIFTPAMIAEARERLHAFHKRKLDLYTVVYVHELAPDKADFLKEFDAISLWCWYEENLLTLEENYKTLRSIIGDEKKIFAGCYMWDYGNRKEISESAMRLQLDTYYEWLKTGKIEGIILCSNCVADLGLKTKDIMLDWMREHGDDEI